MEREKTLGGKLTEASLAPGSEELNAVMEFLIPAAPRAGVIFQLNRNATAETVMAENPDAVVIATGSTLYAPRLPSDGSVSVMTSSGTLAPEELGRGNTVVVMDEDGYFWGSSIAEAVADLGKKLLFVTRFFEPFRELPVISRIAVLRALDNRGAECQTNMEVARVQDGGVWLQHFHTGRKVFVPDVATVIWVGAQQANDSLLETLRTAGIHNVSCIGDALAPRRLLSAIAEGHSAARAL